MSSYEFSLRGVDSCSPKVIAEVRVLRDKPWYSALAVWALADLSLTVALESSSDGGSWTREREWRATSPGWSTFGPPSVLNGPRLRAVVWTLQGKAAVGRFELTEIREKFAS